MACWKAPALAAELRGNELTHWRLEAVARGEGEAVRLQTARCAHYEILMLTSHRARMREDTELMAEKHGAMRRSGDLALHYSAAELTR